jgi:hypothetical protein
MEAKEYEELSQALKQKLNKKIQLTNREDAYNQGILCALSILSSAQKARIQNEQKEK